jgi:hypothetical protein
MRRIVLFAVFASLAATLAVAPALAGKGGNKGGGGGNGGGGTLNASVTATPNPATVGQVVSVSGCGFAFAPVVLSVVHPDGSVENWNVGMWATGCMDGAGFIPRSSGTYTVNIRQGSAVVATTTVNVG